jgi:aminoglycoside phosphotransferase (APT) family kinase protein
VATDDLARELRAVLERAFEEDVEVDGLKRLPGGASRETWMFEASSSCRGTERLILRRDPPGAMASGLRLEAALLEAADLEGVPVPRVVVAAERQGRSHGLSDTDAHAHGEGEANPSLGSAFIVVEYVEGETIPRRILRDDKLAEARAVLAERCGEALAAIHRIPVSAVPGLAGGDPLGQLRELLDRLDEPHPAFELAFRWLETARPPSSGESVVHGDFRNGNLIVGPEGIRAVLDWELAHLGDPLEDLGWLCVKAWRFGSPLPVGGFGSVEQLTSAYQRAGGARVDAESLRWWEVFGTLRWGIICIVQALTHTSGALRSVELAAIGRRVCEVEWDLLELLP